MSWDAGLVCECCGASRGSWNYTHNTNGMANAVLGATSPGRSWWQQLNNLSGANGAALLNRIIKALEAAPFRFRAMNPDNGWGDYDSFVKVLTEMRDAVPEYRTYWEVSG